MVLLPMLSPVAQERIENARRHAGAMTPHAQIHLDRAAQAERNLSDLHIGTGTETERSRLQEERNSSLHLGRAVLRLATSHYFNICAWQYWDELDGSASEFVPLLPIIQTQTEKAIAFPELLETIRETAEAKAQEWMARAQKNARKVDAELQHVQEMHELLAMFFRQCVRSPDRRGELLEELAFDVVGVYLGQVLPKVKGPSTYGQFCEKVGWAKMFMQERLTRSLKAADFISLEVLIDSECERLMAIAAKQGRPDLPVEGLPRQKNAKEISKSEFAQSESRESKEGGGLVEGDSRGELLPDHNRPFDKDLMKVVDLEFAVFDEQPGWLMETEPALRGSSSAAGKPDRTRKGDVALIQGKESVSLRTAGEYLGIGTRQRMHLVKQGSLTCVGLGSNKKITTESLRKYLPEDKAQ